MYFQSSGPTATIWGWGGGAHLYFQLLACSSPVQLPRATGRWSKESKTFNYQTRRCLPVTSKLSVFLNIELLTSGLLLAQGTLVFGFVELGGTLLWGDICLSI